MLLWFSEGYFGSSFEESGWCYVDFLMSTVCQRIVIAKDPYYSPGNQFERFRGFLELIRRFEFDFRRRENYFF